MDSKFFFTIFFVFSTLSAAFNKEEYQEKPTEKHIVATYRILAGKPISPKTFALLNANVINNNWDHIMLLKAIIGLEEVKTSCVLPLYLYISDIPKMSMVDVSSRISTYEELNPSHDKLCSDDLIYGYETIVGKTIGKGFFNTCINACNEYGNTLPAFSKILFSLNSVQKRLGIPKACLTPRKDLVLYNGDKLFGVSTDVYITSVIDADKFWAPRKEQLIKKLVRPDDLVLDIGSYIGYFTSVLSRLVGKGGDVIALDGYSFASDLCLQAKLYNRWSNVTIFNAVLSNKEEPVYFYENDVNPGASSIISPAEAVLRNNEKEGSAYLVMAKTLDSLLMPVIGRLDFIKLSAEGSEDLILDGGMHLISHYMPTIIMRFHPGRYRDRGVNPEAVLQKLLDLGYSACLVSAICNSEDPVADLVIKRQSPKEIVKNIDACALHQDVLLIKIP